MRAIRVAIIACGMVLGFLGWPPGTGAQQTPKMPRIGLLVTGPPPDEHACVIAFRRGLTEIGLVEGRTHVLETRWAEGRPEEAMPRVSRELVTSSSERGGRVGHG